VPERTEDEVRARGYGSREESSSQGGGCGTRRRIEPRQEVDTRAVIRLVNLLADVTGRVIDISAGGCHIRTDSRFPVGVFRRVEAEFCIEGLPLRLAGVTQAIYDPFNVGIRFLDMSERKREQLLQLIEEIRAHCVAVNREEEQPNSGSASES
jgi:hypothetical protein